MFCHIIQIFFLLLLLCFVECSVDISAFVIIKTQSDTFFFLYFALLNVLLV